MSFALDSDHPWIPLRKVHSCYKNAPCTLHNLQNRQFIHLFIKKINRFSHSSEKKKISGTIQAQNDPKTRHDQQNHRFIIWKLTASESSNRSLILKWSTFTIVRHKYSKEYGFKLKTTIKKKGKPIVIWNWKSNLRVGRTGAGRAESVYRQCERRRGWTP